MRKVQDSAEYDVIMVTLLAIVPFGWKRSISISSQIGQGRQSCSKDTYSPCSHRSPNQVIECKWWLTQTLGTPVLHELDPGSKTAAMATAQWVSFYALTDVHYWCQVSEDTLYFVICFSLGPLMTSSVFTQKLKYLLASVVQRWITLSTRYITIHLINTSKTYWVIQWISLPTHWTTGAKTRGDTSKMKTPCFKKSFKWVIGTLNNYRKLRTWNFDVICWM